MTLDTEAQGRVRRASSPENQARRRARELVTPFLERIGPWQLQLAHLRTKRMFHAVPDVQMQAAKLSPLVIGARIELEGAVANCVDKTVAQHNLIASAQAALQRLQEGLEDLQRSD